MLLNVPNNAVVSQNTTMFKGKNAIKKLLKNASKEEQMLEQQRGMMAGLTAKQRGIDECSEIILRETLSLNFNFLKGFNSIIGSDMAKKAYEKICKNISK